MNTNQQSHIKTLIITFIFCIFVAIPSVTNAAPTCATVGGEPVNANDPACYTTQTTNCTWSFYGYDCCNSSGACHYERGNCDAGETPRIGYGHPIVLYRNSCGGVSCNNPHSGPPNDYNDSSDTCYYLVPTTWGPCNASTGRSSATGVRQMSTPGKICSNESMTRTCDACGVNDGRTFTNIHAQPYATFCAGGRPGSVTGWQDTVANDGTWNWSCATARCSATKAASSTPVCGSRARNYSATTTRYPTYSVWCDAATSTVVTNSVVGSYFPAPGGRTTWDCQGKNGGATITCAATRDSAPVDYSCTGSPPAGATACFRDSQNLTANISWRRVNSCTNARKCEYIINASTSYSCTGNPPSVAAMCPGDYQNLTSNESWQQVDYCTNARKCEYTSTSTSVAGVCGSLNGDKCTSIPYSPCGPIAAISEITQLCARGSVGYSIETPTGFGWSCISATREGELCAATKPASFCGDGNKDSNEECDDGNTDNDDDCSNTCQLNPSCGSANDGSFVSAPTTDLCDNATASWTDDDATVDGVFNWNCETETCTATRVEPQPKCGTCSNIPVSATDWPSCTFCSSGSVVGGADPDFSDSWECTNGTDRVQCNTATYCTEKSCTANGTCQATPKLASNANECSSTCNSNSDCSSGRLIETRP